MPGGSVSLSIGSVPAELLSNSTVANVAGSTSAQGGLPFDVILDDQTGSSDEETGEVGGAYWPVALREMAVLAAFAATEPANDRLVGLQNAPGTSIRRSQIGRGEPNDATVISSTGKDGPANEAAALLLLVARD